MAGNSAIDYRPLHTHGHEISDQPRRSTPASSAGFDVALGKGGIVQQAELRDALQSNLDGGPGMSLPLQSATEIAPGE
jgi:hypothetical protein